MSTEKVKQIKLPKEVIEYMRNAGSKNIKGYVMGEFTIITSLDGGEWHFSMSHASRYPTNEEIMMVHKALFPNIVMEVTAIGAARHTVHLFEVKKESASSNHATTLKCPHCSAQNPMGFNFCEKCGQRLLEDKCPNCWRAGYKAVKGNAKSCDECNVNNHSNNTIKIH